MAKGNVLFGTTLTMRSLQKTFSLAVSREMAPAARIVVYAMKDGEIVTDSLNFYVKDTRLLNVSFITQVVSTFCGWLVVNTVKIIDLRLSQRLIYIQLCI